MTDSHNRAIVRRALDELKPYLATYVDQRLAGLSRIRRPAQSDIQAYLRAMLDNWDMAFASLLSATVRHYVFELKDIRNRWAHEEEFSDDEAHRASDTARLVAQSIGAPSQVINGLRKLTQHSADSFEAKATPVAQARPRPRDPAPSVAPRLNAHGVIVNANELTAADVSLQRVLCPACGDKVFETWPGGWDAHAAHACRGASGATEEVRKADFRKRFGHLFRGDGVAAAPSKQRDVMRRLWAMYGPDEGRAIREYAAAERSGEVARARNAYHLTPEDYAKRLLADGLHKGWLRPPR